MYAPKLMRRRAGSSFVRCTTNPSPVPLPDEVHRDSGPPSPQGSLCDIVSLRVIPRSRRRRGIWHCLENTQSEIPLPRLRDRNDSVGRVTTQTPREGAFFLNWESSQSADGSATWRKGRSAAALFHDRCAILQSYRFAGDCGHALAGDYDAD